MLVWFVATAVATVWIVFRDPRFDYRSLVAGVLLPDAVDLWTGGVKPLHSVTVAMSVVVAVMLGTVGRRPLRKILLGVPIGLMLHLVFDGAFADADMFWWPLTGGDATLELPAVARGWWNLPLEAAGAALTVLGIRRFGLGARAHRRRFAASGQLTAVAGSSGEFSGHRV